MSVLPAVELLPPTEGGRTFTTRRTVRLGDVDPEGRLRFDAVGRYLQDVASDDALAVSLPNALGWVVRRTMVDVAEAVGAGEDVELTTFCTGAGRSWAERRTTIRSASGGRIEAVSLWVQVDVTTGRPARLGDGFAAVYGSAAAGRQVSSKLSLPGRVPDGARPSATWRFRRADLDQFGHVNNAAQLAVVEERRDPGVHRGTVEIEYLGPADAGVDLDVVAEGDLVWLVAPDRGPVTVMRWSPIR